MDCKDLILMIQESTIGQIFNRIEEFNCFKRIPKIKIIYHPQVQNKTTNLLGKIAHDFRRSFFR